MANATPTLQFQWGPPRSSSSSSSSPSSEKGTFQVVAFGLTFHINESQGLVIDTKMNQYMRHRFSWERQGHSLHFFCDSVELFDMRAKHTVSGADLLPFRFSWRVHATTGKFLSMLRVEETLNEHLATTALPEEVSLDGRRKELANAMEQNARFLWYHLLQMWIPPTTTTTAATGATNGGGEEHYQSVKKVNAGEGKIKWQGIPDLYHLGKDMECDTNNVVTKIRNYMTTFQDFDDSFSPEVMEQLRRFTIDKITWKRSVEGDFTAQLQPIYVDYVDHLEMNCRLNADKFFYVRSTMKRMLVMWPGVENDVMESLVPLYKEFLHSAGNRYSEQINAYPVVEKHLETVLKNAFDAADLDGSGTIEVKEMAEVLKRLGQELTPAQVSACLKEIDRDGNGTIDWPEFRAFFGDQTKRNSGVLSALNIGAMAKLTMDGEVYKIGGDMHSLRNRLHLHWQLRYCVLDHTKKKLFYYDNKTNRERPNGLLDLQEYEKAEEDKLSPKKCFGFKILPKKGDRKKDDKHDDRVYQMATQSEKERSRWIENINRAIQSEKDQGSTETTAKLSDAVSLIMNTICSVSQPVVVTTPLSGNLNVKIAHGEKIDAANAQCVLHLDNEKTAASTKAISKDQNGVFSWEDEFELTLKDNRVLHFKVKERSLTGGTVLGSGEFYLSDIIATNELALTVGLTPSGCLHVILKFDDVHKILRQSSRNTTGTFDVELQYVPRNKVTNVPLIVQNIIEEIEQRTNLEEEGMYRTTGSVAAVNKLRALYGSSGERTVDLSVEAVPEVHTLTSLLKNFCRSLPDSIIPSSYYSELCQIANSEKEGQGQQFVVLLNSLQPVNRATFAFILDHLHRLEQHKAVNLMTANNIARCLGPLLVPSERDAMNFESQINVLEALLLNWERIRPGLLLSESDI